MKYRRPGPQYKLVIIPTRTIEVNGINRHQLGLKADFRGNPPICDTEREAKIYVDWEVKVGKIDFTNKEARERRFQEINTLVMSYIESNRDFIKEWDGQRNNAIMREVSQVKQMELEGRPICLYCGAHNFETYPQLQAHQAKEHKEEMLKELMADESPGELTKENDQNRANSQSPEQV